uniref:Uncharacterized protein n=1 Tax=viral metagenome TaxID=1070528 RepID=A0A6C0HFQ8_9ZZZZ
MEELLQKIHIVKQNDYRVADVVLRRGPRWTYSSRKIIEKDIYNGSILKQYLRRNGLFRPLNLNMLLNIIINKNKQKNLPVPDNNEIVMHLRMGDFVDFASILTKNYISLIKNKLIENTNINKITIVTAYAYGSWSEEEKIIYKSLDKKKFYDCTKETQRKNIKGIKSLLKSIVSTFPNLTLDIYSNLDIDKDICYCVLSNHFINDIGGFSNLMKRLNNLRKRRLQNDIYLY